MEFENWTLYFWCSAKVALIRGSIFSFEMTFRTADESNLSQMKLTNTMDANIIGKMQNFLILIKKYYKERFQLPMHRA